MIVDPRPAIMAEFAGPDTLRDAARALKGREGMDAFTPYPVHGLARILGMRPTRMPWVMVAGGLTGAACVYALILYSVFIDYPINVGGRGLHAWPAYVVVAFEGGILGAALAGVFGMFFANRFPAYHHPVFDTPGFSYAQGGGFWLLVPVDDTDAGPMFDRLAALGATRVEVLE